MIGNAECLWMRPRTVILGYYHFLPKWVDHCYLFGDNNNYSLQFDDFDLLMDSYLQAGDDHLLSADWYRLMMCCYHRLQ